MHLSKSGKSPKNTQNDFWGNVKRIKLEDQEDGQ